MMTRSYTDLMHNVKNVESFWVCVDTKKKNSKDEKIQYWNT